MKDAEKYRILRTAKGDIVQRLYKAYHIGASGDHNAGGGYYCTTAYNPFGTNVATQWRNLDPTRYHNKIAEVERCPNVPIIRI
jgi:hypothetical protein